MKVYGAARKLTLRRNHRYEVVESPTRPRPGLTLINAGLVQGKGRSELAWWLLSCFLGPIATFLIVVLPRGPHKGPTSRGGPVTR